MNIYFSYNDDSFTVIRLNKLKHFHNYEFSYVHCNDFHALNFSRDAYISRAVTQYVTGCTIPTPLHNIEQKN